MKISDDEKGGTTALITGANSGVGLQAAISLAGTGARVLMGCRDQARAEAALAEVSAACTGPQPQIVPLDLANLHSVQEAAVMVDELADHLDVLINNAGVMLAPNQPTADGFEPHLGVNLLGHFALTGRLLGSLLRAPRARVVTTGSVAARIPGTRMRWEDVHWRRTRFRPIVAYSQSKLACLLFATEFARRAAATGTSLVSVAAHPGGANTGLMRHDRRYAFATATVLRPLLQSPAMGALPTLYAATDPGLTGGEYIGPDGLLGLSGRPHRIALSRAERDFAAGRRLWEFAEEATGVHYPWPAPLLTEGQELR
jgi:NAD(P)-dependent dehydrogenase (short-subunit alcohol dehydrogenase family)